MQINEVIFYKNISEYYKSHILIGKKNFSMYLPTYLPPLSMLGKNLMNSLKLSEKNYGKTHTC